jgi:hypothetical protein
MKTRKKILFKLHHDVVHEDPRDLSIRDIEGIKWAIAKESGEPFDSVDVELEEEIIPDENSEYDVSSDGMRKWDDVSITVITGLSCPYEIGSDEHLQAITDGTLLDQIKLK